MSDFCSDTNFTKFKKFLVKQRILFQRGGGIITTPSLAYIVASLLQLQLNDRGIHISLFVMLPLAAMIIWIIGYAEFKLRMYQMEMEWTWGINPVMIELRRLIEEIHKNKDK
jgi:hypothetical protein